MLVKPRLMDPLLSLSPASEAAHAAGPPGKLASKLNGAGAGGPVQCGARVWRHQSATITVTAFVGSCEVEVKILAVH